MKTKIALSALLIAALPLVAQADPATERALSLNQGQPSAEQSTAQGNFEPTHLSGSAAMVKARQKLIEEQNHATEFTVGELSLAREATNS
ncbi:hypothetical protein [Halomonas binhaiensis]|uniref:DUF4148 domain-containing protein n=1 Tax=Halomonas binhaiensis TaxID=2562282 RepID=A0A5C1NAP6_9GAMM|nr:hypothetical protein [Halomonas binhaiensis]QEM80151.1 hypothetical protein E4T21_00215 [Halomonas binhaiensis]